jgi:hypothetical protein
MNHWEGLHNIKALVVISSIIINKVTYFLSHKGCLYSIIFVAFLLDHFHRLHQIILVSFTFVGLCFLQVIIHKSHDKETGRYN